MHTWGLLNFQILLIFVKIVRLNNIGKRNRVAKNKAINMMETDKKQEFDQILMLI
jgi:hypothetical protein